MAIQWIKVLPQDAPTLPPAECEDHDTGMKDAAVIDADASSPVAEVPPVAEPTVDAQLCGTDDAEQLLGHKMLVCTKLNLHGMMTFPTELTFAG